MHPPGTTFDIEIFLNGGALTTRAQSMSALVSDMGFGGKKIATALNGHFVSEAQRATTTLKPGDRVEIVSPRQGG